MERSFRPLSILFLIALTFGFVRNSRADGFTYTYTGLPFDSFSMGSTCPPQCGITATLNIPVPASEGLVDFTTISATDGLYMLEEIGTVSNIQNSETGWSPNFGMFLFSLTSFPISTTACATGQHEMITMSFTNEADDFSEGDCVDSSGNVESTLWHDTAETGGIWSGPGLTASTMPEPSSLLLLGAGLTGLVGFRRRQHRIAR